MCEDSLCLLGVDHVALYYQHHIDTAIPIEDIVSSRWSTLVSSRSCSMRGSQLHWLIRGEPRHHLACSRGAPDLHADGVVYVGWLLSSPRLCLSIGCSMDLRELRIVPYGPIARGYFGGRGVTEQMSDESYLGEIIRCS